MAQELPYYPSSIYTLILFALARLLWETLQITLWEAEGWPGSDGKGFFLGKEEGGVCRLHSSIKKKTYLRLHLLNWRHLSGLSNRAIVLATMHQMFPVGVVIGKVHSGDCLSCWTDTDVSGEQVRQRALFSTDVPNVDSISCRPSERLTYGDWRQRDCPFDGVRLLEYVEFSLARSSWMTDGV